MISKRKRNKLGQGRVRLSAFSSIRKVARALRRGKFEGNEPYLKTVKK